MDDLDAVLDAFGVCGAALAAAGGADRVPQLYAEAYGSAESVQSALDGLESARAAEALADALARDSLPRDENGLLKPCCASTPCTTMCVHAVVQRYGVAGAVELRANGLVFKNAVEKYVKPKGGPAKKSAWGGTHGGAARKQKCTLVLQPPDAAADDARQRDAQRARAGARHEGLRRLKASVDAPAAAARGEAALAAAKAGSFAEKSAAEAAREEYAASVALALRGGGSANRACWATVGFFSGTSRNYFLNVEVGGDSRSAMLGLLTNKRKQDGRSSPLAELTESPCRCGCSALIASRTYEVAWDEFLAAEDTQQENRVLTKYLWTSFGRRSPVCYAFLARLFEVRAERLQNIVGLVELAAHYDVDLRDGVTFLSVVRRPGRANALPEDVVTQIFATYEIYTRPSPDGAYRRCTQMDVSAVSGIYAKFQERYPDANVSASTFSKYCRMYNIKTGSTGLMPTCRDHNVDSREKVLTLSLNRAHEAAEAARADGDDDLSKSEKARAARYQAKIDRIRALRTEKRDCLACIMHVDRALRSKDLVT